MTNVSINKRTVLGGQYWTIAVVGATDHLAGSLVLAGSLALALAVVGTYLVLWPALGFQRKSRPSRFLLRAK